MKETQRISEQLQRAFAGGAWHGPGVLEILENVTATQAAERPIAGAHSIWELVHHIRAWDDACRRRLLGDRAQLPDEEDWPPVSETSDEAWDKTLATLREAHDRLIAEIANVDAAKLDEPILQGLATVYTTLHGAVQHNLYHAGQIAILKKASTGETA